MMFSSISKLLLILVSTSSSTIMMGYSYALDRKMVTQAMPPGRRLTSNHGNAVAMTTHSTVVLEECTPGVPLTFPLSAGEGKGAIGIMHNVDNVDVSLTLSNGELEVEPDKIPNVFSVLSHGEDEGTAGVRFMATNVPDSGGEVSVDCTADTTILFMYKDRSGFQLDYEITTTGPGNSGGNGSSSGRLTLPNRQAAVNLQGRAYGLGQGNSDNTRRRLHQGNVNFHNGNQNSIEFDTDTPGRDVVLVQVQLEEDGKTLYRSILEPTVPAPPSVADMELDDAEVDDDGFLHLHFTGIPSGTKLVRVALAVELRGQILEDNQFELSAEVDDGHLVFHGGWVRTALENAADVTPGSTNGWKVLVTQAVAEDPNDSYRTVAAMSGHARDSGVVRNKQLLSTTPSDEERAVSDDMRMGRRPTQTRRLGESSRRLAQSNLLLVHGYCAGNNHPWNRPEFTGNTKLVEDYGQSRSNDSFAKLIRDWDGQSFQAGDSCGIVAHSQGGLAALHLYTYYWSCLDNAGSGRLIQSVGSSYQGTSLAGEVALLGSIFGIGCGYNSDLTYAGASSWLSGIPSWARSKVNYYTTSFKDNWWSYDYCQFASDLLLSDPDDGVIEKWSGQLSGAINRGHTNGQCHTTGMEEPAQYTDSGRNSAMNTYAAR